MDFGAEPHRVTGFGRSAGAHLFSMLAYGPELSEGPHAQSTRPNAFVNNVGVTDWSLFDPSVALGYYFGAQYATIGDVPEHAKTSASAVYHILNGGPQTPTLSLYTGPTHQPPLSIEDGHDLTFGRVLHAAFAGGPHTLLTTGMSTPAADIVAWINAATP